MIVQIRLCKLSIYHFQQYVHLTPGDPDNAKINEAVSILQQRLDTFNKLNKVNIRTSSIIIRLSSLA